MSGVVIVKDLREAKLVFKALADLARLRVIGELSRGGEVPVTQLADALRISQPLVSWHLSILRKAGLVTVRRHGRLVYCSLHQERFTQVRERLGDLAAGVWPGVAAADLPPLADQAI